jgi:hypothetical protein
MGRPDFMARRKRKLKELLAAMGAPLPWSDTWAEWSKIHSEELVRAHNEAEEYARTAAATRKPKPKLPPLPFDDGDSLGSNE